MGSPQRKVRVAIHASDPIDRAGLIDYVRQDHRLSEVDDDGVRENDIFVVSVDTMGNSTLDVLRSWPGVSAAKFLLIVKDEWTVDASTAMACGVRGVLRYTDCSPAIFSQALLVIDAGGREIPEPVKEMFMEQTQQKHASPLADKNRSTSGLNDQELLLLRLAAEGLNNSEIAKKMSCSKGAVKTTLRGLMEHLDLRNRAHAVAYAIRSGVI